jgi:hypothetical protein
MPSPDQMPEWVHVWFWLRFLRGDQDLTPLPQQGINPESMSMERYGLLEREWVAAGAPSTSARQIIMAMGGEDDGIPF